MFKRKKLPQRKYHDGDVIEFDFKPDFLDIDGQNVTLTGIISGVSYEDDGIRYKVQLRDDERKIFGDINIPENMINGKIEKKS